MEMRAPSPAAVEEPGLGHVDLDMLMVGTTAARVFIAEAALGAVSSQGSRPETVTDGFGA